MTRSKKQKLTPRRSVARRWARELDALFMEARNLSLYADLAADRAAVADFTLPSKDLAWLRAKIREVRKLHTEIVRYTS